jgi:hypothetical protein
MPKKTKDSSSSSDSISSIRNILEQQKISCRPSKNQEVEEESKRQLVSSLKKLSPSPSFRGNNKIRRIKLVSKSKDKKKQRVRFKNETGREERKNNMT